ncbi:FCD domain-containing protein [Phenylobacterium sp.]|uniref:FCD domain-containing protein n=1 Tax=Phenylobacterium sp. TaxID=1871053 RepID=UPI0025D18044|nr:FCD domain-containing protein [Phenylobacterium sp.]
MPTSLPSVATFHAPELDALSPELAGPTDKAAFWLQRDIVRGVFQPYERLKVEQLTKFYKLGHSPIREAILLLSSTGLVVHEHQKGYRVAPVSVADYLDVLDAYQAIYHLVLSKSVERGDEAWEERVVVVLHRTMKVRKVMPDGDPLARELWQRAYKALHRELLSGSGSPVLQRIYSNLGDRAERYLNLYADFEADRERDHHAEHREIVDALIARDGDRLHRLIGTFFAGAQPMRDIVVQRLEAIEAQNGLRRRRAAPARPAVPKPAVKKAKGRKRA